MNNRTVKEAFAAGTQIDRAMDRAFFAAVRLHRMHGLPMALWRDGQVSYVDAGEIPLPEEVEAAGDPLGYRSAPNRQRTKNGSGSRHTL
jgi:hypothetical protein